ncbi:MAG: DUF222 domain-containing protein [Geodermatophilaceae bacterium]|nr:DUF222 domain-containing protein [Geodermatophilaceae bacterium]
MFEGEFTGDWVYADGEWHQEIYDPTELDPAAIVETGADLPIPGCPTGAGLAILLAGISNDRVPDATVLDRIVGYERLAAWAAAGQARALAELSTRRTATDPNELPYAVEEVSLALSCSRMAAGTKVNLALDLAGRLPATLDAWEQGRICQSRARILSEGSTRLSAEDAAFVEGQLLAQAEKLSPSRLKVKVAALADSLDPREIEDRHANAAQGRKVIKEPREDGMACLWALLPADDAAAVWAAINARCQADRDPDDTRTADQRRADAFTDLARLYLTGATNIDPDTGQVGVAPRVPAWAQVQVKLDAGMLLGTSTEPAQLRGHGPIPASMAIRLAADAQWQRIIYHPKTGALLDVGTTRHDPPPALREFVLARDGTCNWANCAQPRVDLDDLIPYPAGPTAAHNLDAKCRHHHRTKQRWNFTSVRHPDGSSTITTPTGHTYTHPARDHRPPPARKPRPDKPTHEPCRPGHDDDPPPF